jgi:hypothetical protein
MSSLSTSLSFFGLTNTKQATKFQSHIYTLDHNQHPYKRKMYANIVRLHGNALHCIISPSIPLTPPKIIFEVTSNNSTHKKINIHTPYCKIPIIYSSSSFFQVFHLRLHPHLMSLLLSDTCVLPRLHRLPV